MAVPTTINCPKCGGALDVRQTFQVNRLAERDDVLCFFMDGTALSDFDVRCRRAPTCDWSFYGSFSGLAKRLGRKVAS